MSLNLSRLILTLVVALTLGTIAQAQTPGTPCLNQDVACTANPNLLGVSPSAPGFTFTLPTDPGVVHLPIFVVPGDVVLFETPNGMLADPTTWSDVVEFSSVPGVHGSFATTFPDAEPVGILLPAGFALSRNALGILETTTGTGSDAVDSTPYTAGAALYNIHSDCSGASPCEAKEPPETPEPATISLLGLGLAAVLRLGRNKVHPH
jgi:hypothetical protein